MARLAISTFARRHAPTGGPPGFHGSWEELLTLTEAQWALRAASPHHGGVVRVPMPDSALPKFSTRTVALTPETPLRVKFAPRATGETPFAQLFVAGEGVAGDPARMAEVILYSHEALAADDDAPAIREADYYIVAVNAYPESRPEPMHPMTMARNLLGMTGGTRPETPYTAEAFAEAVVYWSVHARRDICD